jgi:hypothetical protein
MKRSRVKTAGAANSADLISVEQAQGSLQEVFLGLVRAV